MPRGKDETSDEKLKLKLMSSEKDRAENLMIVDLIRNDLGKNCETGSVQVKDLFALESYPNVHHLVSTIEGKLLRNISAWMAYCDAFPGGSITGAPKQRSMEIISELEEFAREVYCGSIFYLSFSGSMNSNIAIRTLVAKNGVLNYFSGGGITRGSSAQSEFQEIQDKAANIENVITYFRRDNDSRGNNQ
jgi:para-aminobenzoate synthetase component 1